MGELRSRLMELLRSQLRPEFLNRIDEIIVFKPLSAEETRMIVDLQMDVVARMLKASNIGIIVADDVKDWLAKLGYDPLNGARPLKRVIQKYIVNPLSAELLEGAYGAGESVRIDVDDAGQIIFS